MSLDQPALFAHRIKFVLLSWMLLFLVTLPGFSQGTQNQTINFLPIADRPVNSAPFQVIALSSASLPVTLSVQGPATLSSVERTLILTGVGTVTLTASQAGNADYAPATATLSFQPPGSPQRSLQTLSPSLILKRSRL